jgi:hypothetical protein
MAMTAVTAGMAAMNGLIIFVATKAASASGMPGQALALIVRFFRLYAAIAALRLRCLSVPTAASR